MIFIERFFQNRFFIFILCFLPLVFYGWFFQSVALNANYIAYDDIHVLEITDQWREATNWIEKLDWLTVGFPEHRIVFTRLMVLTTYYLTGGVNLKMLMVISNLLWIGQLWILYLIFRKSLLPVAYFIPIFWILLGVHSFENIFWATSSLGNFGLLFFVMVAGYFYTKEAKGLIAWALLFSVIATFSYGNGLLAFLVGGFVLAITKRWRDLGITIGVFTVTMVLYLLTRTNATPKVLDLTMISNYWRAVSCYFGFIGSSVSLDVYVQSNFILWLSVGWGILLFGSIAFFVLPYPWAVVRSMFSKTTKKIAQPSHLKLFALFLFLFVSLTALGVIYKRSQWDGLEGMFKGRYRMYPTWLLAIGYLLVIDGMKRARSVWFLISAIGLSVLFNLLVLYYAIAPAVNNRRMAAAQEFNSMYNADWIGVKMFDLTGEDFLRLQKLYQPNLFFKAAEKNLFPIKTRLQKGFVLDSVYLENDNVFVSYQKDYIRPSKDFDDGAYVLLQSPLHTYMHAGIQQALPLKTFLRRGWYWSKGFTAAFNRHSVAPGIYRIYVLLRQNGQNDFIYTGREMTF